MGTIVSEVPFPCLSSFPKREGPAQDVYDCSLGTFLVQLCSAALNCFCDHILSAQQQQQIAPGAGTKSPWASLSPTLTFSRGAQRACSHCCACGDHLNSARQSLEGRSVTPCWLSSIKPGCKPLPMTFTKERGVTGLSHSNPNPCLHHQNLLPGNVSLQP